MNFYTKEYTFSTNIVIFSSTNLSLIEDSSIKLYKYNNSEYISVPFTYQFLNQELKIFPESIQPKTVYVVVLENILNFKNEIIPKEIIKVFSKNSSLVRNPNDIYYQLQTVDNLNSIEKIILSNDNKNYSFYPVEYNIESKKFNHSIVNSEKVIINENVSNITRDLYINQNALEFKNFFNDILNIEKIYSSYSTSEDEIKKLNVLILENITKINALKGTKKLMEIVLSIYARVLNYQLISVVEDKNFNFLYRISTSIPKEFWVKNIKPIVHPCGWFDIYNYIDSVVADKVVDISKERLNFKKFLLENFSLDTLSELDADYTSKCSSLKQFIHLYGNILPENVTSHEETNHLDCRFSGLYNEHKLSRKWGFEQSPWNYYVNSINSTIYDTKNYKFHNNRLENTYYMGYNKPGVGIEYIWKIYKQNRLIKIQRTPFSFFTLNKLKPISEAKIGSSFILSSSFNNTGFYDYVDNVRVELTLKRYNWEKTIYQYDSSKHKNYKALTPISCQKNHFKYLNYIVNNTHLSMDSSSLGSLASEYNNTAFGFQNETEYTFFDSEPLTLDFQNEFDKPENFKVVVEDKDDISKFSVLYNKPGISKKYTWDIYFKDELIRKVETFLNKFEIYISPNEEQFYKVYLTLDINGEEYKLNNFVGDGIGSFQIGSTFKVS